MRNVRPMTAARENRPSMRCPSPSACTPSTAHASRAPLTSVVPTASMNLQPSAAHLRFRNALRAWLAANLPRPWREELREPGATETSLIELRRAWQRKLYKAGYLGMDWPHEWGGRGGTEVEKSIMEAELARADAPPILNILGIGLLGPALIHHGTEAQRRRFIPPMLAGDEIWCQGFSEPGA